MSSGVRHVEVVAMTHQGALRSHNEDTVLVSRWMRTTPMEMPQRFRLENTGSVLCLVADGMGGHAAGAEASRRACELLAAAAEGMETEDSIARTLIAVDDELTVAGRTNPTLTGMGTTVAGLVLRAERAFWFNVGDSTVFRFRDGFLRQLSVDDVPQSDRFGQRSHRITQALGGRDDGSSIAPHTGEEPRVLGWRYLLCSDGLTDMLTPDQIERALAVPEPLESVSWLHDAAMAAGGQDNISMLLVSWIDGPEKEGEDHGID